MTKFMVKCGNAQTNEEECTRCGEAHTKKRLDTLNEQGLVDTITSALVDKLKERYKIHPLLFARCCELSHSPGELFDLLDELTPDRPLIWDEEKQKWIKISFPF